MPHLFIHNNTCYNRCYVFFIFRFSMPFQSHFPSNIQSFLDSLPHKYLMALQVSFPFLRFCCNKIFPTCGPFPCAITISTSFSIIFTSCSAVFPMLLAALRSSFSRLYRISLVQLQFFFVPYSSPPVDFCFHSAL